MYTICSSQYKLHSYWKETITHTKVTHNVQEVIGVNDHTNDDSGTSPDSHKISDH
jgi:hypothetical protein